MTGQAEHKERPIHIDFICTGNICRSPMAEVIIRDKIEDAGLAGKVKITSAGMGGWHVGQGADRRAVEELRRAGYDGATHIANQVGPTTLAADLIVALDTGHRSELIASGAEEDKVALLRDFDPAAEDDASVADPYYGGPEGFRTTRNQIEAAAPGIVDWIRARL